MDLGKRAKQLYDACPSVKPPWEQLGDVTRSVWLDRAAADTSDPKHTRDGADAGGATGAAVAQSSLF